MPHVEGHRRYGRRPPKNTPALRLSSILSGDIPDHPAAADYLGTAGWQMLGNDTYGDCVAVTWANERRLISRQAGHETYPDIDQVLEFYKTQNPGFPGQDDGMVIQTALEDLTRAGGPDGVKAVAFAKVDHTNPDEVKAAIAIFGQVWVGVNVQQANQDDFAAGQPWDYHPHSPIEGGHSVVAGGYDSDQAGGDERFITWAAETAFTDTYWTHLVEEAWVVVWPEHFTATPFLAGVDQQKLAAAYHALTGRTLVVPPVNPPAPPAPGGTSFPGSSAAVDQHVAHAAARARMTVPAWLEHHLETYFDLGPQ